MGTFNCITADERIGLRLPLQLSCWCCKLPVQISTAGEARCSPQSVEGDKEWLVQKWPTLGHSANGHNAPSLLVFGSNDKRVVQQIHIRCTLIRQMQMTAHVCLSVNKEQNARPTIFYNSANHLSLVLSLSLLFPKTWTFTERKERENLV